jgi:hypothetical protein
MATVYRVLDAAFDPATNSYRVTVEINKDNQGPMVFAMNAPRLVGTALDPAVIAQAAALWMSVGGGISLLRTQSWTVT